MNQKHVEFPLDMMQGPCGVSMLRIVVSSPAARRCVGKCAEMCLLRKSPETSRDGFEQLRARMSEGVRFLFCVR